MNPSMGLKSLVVIVVTIAIVSSGVAQTAPDGASLYKSHCVTCHAANGGGRSTMKNTDLRAAAVQKLTDGQLLDVLANGQGKMPAYKSKLTTEQLAKLVSFIRALPAEKAALIDLNTASREQLMTLPGITAAAADRIIASRPYATKADLVNKKVLTRAAYAKIATKVTLAAPVGVAKRGETAVTTASPLALPQGTKMSIRLVDAIDSSVNKPGDTFRATVETPVMVNGKEVIPKYAEVTGQVVNVESAGHFTGRSELGIILTTVSAAGQTYSLKTQALAKEGSSRGVRTAVIVGGGAAAGAVIGAIAGGAKGAAIGGAAGAGAGAGVQALTKPEQVRFPSETVLEFELQEPATSAPAGTVAAAVPKTTAPATAATEAPSTWDKIKEVVTGSSAASAVKPASTTGQVDNTSQTPAQVVQPATGGGSGLSLGKIADGLKEALAIGTANAVAATGKPDGFLGNPAIKIPLPSQLKSLGSGARFMGLGSQVDELEVGMNRAAEQATPYAKQIFLDAVSRMSFADARQILNGGDTAATDYFKAHTTSQLTAAFKPIVHTAMENVGVIKQYNAIAQTPMAGSLGQNFSLDDYVVGKTLDGLFYTLGQEEKKIRTDPFAQTTSLLKEVFGKK